MNLWNGSRQLGEQEFTEIAKRLTPARILLFIHSMRGGGSERQMSYLANELVRSSTVRLVTLDEPGDNMYPLDADIERVGLELTSNTGGFLRGAYSNLHRIRRLRQAISDWNPSLVISFCDSNNVLALLACPTNIPVVISERSDPRYQRLNRFWEIMRRYSYPKCRFCIVQTEEVGYYLSSSKLVPAAKIRVIPSAICFPAIDLEAIEHQRESNNPKTLIFVGRLSREKNVQALLRAWAALSPRHPDWELMIVGDGQERESLQNLASQLGISRSVRWMLWRDDVWSLLGSANAYCLVSQYEGFPQSMLEAMAAGLPVAVTDCSPAIRYALEDEVNGLIVHDESQIESKLERLLSNRELRFSLGRKGAKRAGEFEWENIAPQWIDAITRAMS